MVFVENMKSMKIYKQPCFLPTVEGNKKKDSAVILLSPSYESSKILMNHPLFVNKKRFESYFLDRDVSYYIGSKQLKEVDEAFLYLEETKRSELKDSDFGIPEDRKFPLDTEEHVRSAIKLFGHAEESKKKSLAKRISRKASKYGVKIPETTQCYKYLHENSIYHGETLIFDLGSVLVGESPVINVMDSENCKDIPNEYIKEIYNAAEEMFCTGDFENGSIDEEVQYLESKVSDGAKPYIYPVYLAVVDGCKPYGYTEKLLQGLKEEGCALYYLSNWNKSSFERNVETGNFDFLKYFDGGIVSYQVGCRKPEPEIYNHLIDQYNLNPERCRFFDDRKENLKAAENLGFKTRLFDDQATYKDLLSNPVMEAFQPAEMDDNLEFLFSVPDKDIIDIKFEMDEKEKRWNSIVIVKGVAPKTLRGRSECIVIKDDMIYLDETESGICSKGGIAGIMYDVPGGGWDPNEPHDICAIRETNEEAMIDVKDVQYVDNYLTIDKVRPDGCYCDGLFSKVYIGKYAGKYTGPIADVDRADIAVSGAWYNIDEVFDKLNPIHQKAINQYRGVEDSPKLKEAIPDLEDPATWESPVDEATSANPAGLYHVSKYNLDGRMISPTTPNNFLTKNGYEDKEVKRVCFSNTIGGCLMGLSRNLTGEELYVYTPDDLGKYNILKPDIEEVPDSQITNEYWICSPVKMKLYGKIKVIDSTGDPIPYKYGEYTAELYPWNWEWIEKVKESKDNSDLSDDFKKKSGYTFTLLDLNDAIKKDYVEDKWKRNNSEAVVAICNETDEVAGFVYVNKSGVCGSLRIYDKYQGYGLSNDLMKYAVDKLGAKELGVYTDNQVAINLYKKFGFKDNGKRKKYKDGDEVMFMSLAESYVANEKDILYNKEAFDNGDINLCFITGHSGSGKSTMGNKAAGKDVDTYSLDDLQCVADHFTMENLKEYGDLIYSYFKGPGKKFYMTFKELEESKLPGSEYEDKLYPGFVHYAMQYAASHKDKKFIVEGVWLYGEDDNRKPWFKPEEFKDYAFYIKGTSALVSKYRGAKRDSQWENGSNKELKGFDRFKAFTKRFFLKDWKWYIMDEKCINRFRKYFEKQEKTIKESTINSIEEGTEFVLTT